jgi:O-succinylbenzoic acid--CoA ligase
MLVEAWLPRAAATAPNATAIETPGASCSYAELLSAARVGAAQLSERGAHPGAHVAIALPSGLAFAQAFHACLLLGAVAVPVDLRLSESERSAITAGAAVVVEQPLAQRSQRAVEVSPEHDLSGVAAIIHTSGTTSAPRPIELTYGNFLWSALGSAVALGLDPAERWLCALPLAHVGGLSILVRSAIYATTALVHERFDTEAVVDALEQRGVTLVSVVATTLTRMLDAGLADPPALRCALAGGGPVPEALLGRARAAGVPVRQTYGLTEACSQATTTPIAAFSQGLSLDAGPPLFCTRLRVDGGDGQRKTRGEGEILLAGPTIAPGSVGPDGWLRTGDEGRIDEHGALRVTGRKADTIVSGGENVAPSEVEAVIEAHPAVLEAAVVGRADPQWGEAIVAIVVVRPEATVSEQELRAHCGGRLAAFKVPKRVSLIGGPLPRTRSGKLLRRELT